jgi:N-acetylglutamate synthase-like GNAT family acetyltransferase
MTILFKLLGPEHQPEIVDHLLSLDREDRVLRFSTPIPDPIIRNYCGRWHFDRDIVTGAWEDGHLIGMVHLPVYDERVGTVGEVGVSVAAAYRKHGIATQLTARTLLEAKRRGLTRVYIHFLTRNRPMNLLARRFTDAIVMDEDESHATIDLTDAAMRRATAVLRPTEAGATLEFRRVPERSPGTGPGASRLAVAANREPPRPKAA